MSVSEWVSEGKDGLTLWKVPKVGIVFGCVNWHCKLGCFVAQIVRNGENGASKGFTKVGFPLFVDLSDADDADDDERAQQIDVREIPEDGLCVSDLFNVRGHPLGRQIDGKLVAERTSIRMPHAHKKLGWFSNVANKSLIHAVQE